MLAEEMSTEMATSTWLCVFKSRILESSVKILRPFLQDKLTMACRSLARIRSKQCSARIRRGRAISKMECWSIGVLGVNRIDPSFHNSTVPFRCLFQRFELLERVERLERF